MSVSRRDVMLGLAGGAVGVWAGGWPAFARERAPRTICEGSTPPPLIAQMSQVPIAVEKLAEGITVISGPGGNVTVIATGAGKVAIDSGLPARGKDFLAAAVATDGKPVDTLINTHFHFDHVGGNEAFAASGARIVASAKTRKRLAARSTNDFMGITFEPYPKAAWPTTTFESPISLYADDQELRLIPLEPAHTDTDVAIHLPTADVLVMGDLFFNGFYPFIDYSANGTVEGMIAAGEKLGALAGEKTRIVPGHGPVGDRKQLAAFVAMLKEASGRVDAAISKGMTEQQASEAGLLDDLNATWGQRMFTGNKFVLLLYRCKKHK